MNKLFMLIAVLIAYCCFKDKINDMIPSRNKFTSDNRSKFTAVTCDESVICNQE